VELLEMLIFIEFEKKMAVAEVWDDGGGNVDQKI
jgi:hypothetical protein